MLPEKDGFSRGRLSSVPTFAEVIDPGEACGRQRSARSSSRARTYDFNARCASLCFGLFSTHLSRAWVSDKLQNTYLSLSLSLASAATRSRRAGSRNLSIALRVRLISTFGLERLVATRRTIASMNNTSRAQPPKRLRRVYSSRKDGTFFAQRRAYSSCGKIFAFAIYCKI